jgi:hypothetical protein
LTRLKRIKPDVGITIRSPGACPAIGLVGADIFAHPATTATTATPTAAGGFGLAAFTFARFGAVSTVFVVTFGSVAFTIGFGRCCAFGGLITAPSTTAAAAAAAGFTIVCGLFGPFCRTARCQAGRGF